MTPFSDDFISARVNNIYPGNPNQGSGGVFVNLTIQLDGSTVIRNYVQSDLQKQLVAVVHRRNNNIGNSALYVDSPTGSVSALEGKNFGEIINKVSAFIMFFSSFFVCSFYRSRRMFIT